MQVAYARNSIIHSDNIKYADDNSLWPLLLTWFNFNPSMDM